MASKDDEKSPLLVNIEPDPVEFRGPRKRVRDLFERDDALRPSNAFLSGDERGLIRVSPSGSLQNLTEIDHIVAMFVVAFDTRYGKSY